MTIEEIRKLKPYLATHYNQNADYFRTLGHELQMWNRYNEVWFSVPLLDTDILKPL